MAIFCIPKPLVEKLKKSSLRTNTDIAKLVEMSSKERRAFFAEQTDAELGKFLNAKFEGALSSSQKSALTDWAKSVFTPKEQAKPAFKSVLDKINQLDEIGVLSPESEAAFLEDLVTEKLGVSVSADEVAEIRKRAKKIDEAATQLGDDFSNPEKYAENIKFAEAKKEMDDYLMSKMPANVAQILTGTIGRGMMLASFKSPLLNIGSNIEVGITEALSRRIADNQWTGTDSKLAKDYRKMARDIYSKTGYDISRMTSLSDMGGSGGRVLDSSVNVQGDGAVRKTGQIVQDIVFKNLMGRPDAEFAAAHFADSVNLHSKKLAKGDSAQAREMMVDAMRLNPRTDEGKVLRAQAILDAQVATWTNKTWASELTLGIRKILNNLSGDARVGDYALPFVKTPANVIATGIDYAGGGIVKAIADTATAYKTGQLSDPAYTKKMARNLVRSGIGLTGAAVLANLFDEDDFMGAYDPQRAQVEELKNSRENSVRIAGKWVSTDWFGPLAIPFTAMMYAKKYGDTPEEKGYQYGKGLFQSILNLPGIEDAIDLSQAWQYDKNKSFEEMASSATDNALEQAYSRLVPSIFADIAKATDPYQRETGQGLQSIKAAIPGLRQTLPIRQDVFGRDIKAEDPLTTLLFGARVRSDRGDAITDEISRLIEANDKSLNFTDFDKTSSLKLAQFKESVGNDTYEEAQKYYGEELRKAIEKTVGTTAYDRMNDSEKLEALNDLDGDIIDRTFAKYRFRYVTPR